MRFHQVVLLGMCSVASCLGLSYALARVDRQPGESAYPINLGERLDRAAAATARPGDARFRQEWDARGLSSLRLESVSYDLRVLESPDGKLRAELEGDGLPDPSRPVEVSERGGRLALKVAEGEGLHRRVRSFRLSFGERSAAQRTLTLYVPKGLAPRLELQTVSGDIRVEKPGLESVRARSVSGDQRIAARRLRRLEAETVSGGLEFDGAAERVEARSASGDIRLRLDAAPEQLDLASLSGDLTAEAPRPANASVSYTTMSGSVSAPDTLNPGELGRGQSRTRVVGSGSGAQARWSFRTASGDIRIR